MSAEIDLNFKKLNENILKYFRNNDESLDGAKELFSSFIQSNRQLESVKNIQQLLALLQRRGLYSPTEFNTFRIFQKIIDDESFSSLVAKHQELLKSYEKKADSNITNKYANERNSQKRDDETDATSHSVIHIPNNERNEIFNIIANGISNDLFRRLARHLDFTKEEIMDIELKCSDYRTKNLVLLQMYETRRNSLSRLIKILHLIEKSDLVREITEVLKRNQ